MTASFHGNLKLIMFVSIKNLENGYASEGRSIYVAVATRAIMRAASSRRGAGGANFLLSR